MPESPKSAAPETVEGGDKQQRSPSAASSGPHQHGSESARRPSGFNGVRGSSYARLAHRHNQTFCQVEACGRDLVEEKDYYRRYKVCHNHATQSAVLVRGIQQRFCQQCGTFHTLDEFDLDKRSCRQALTVHNIKRRKRNPDGSAKGLDPSTPEVSHYKHRSQSVSAFAGQPTSGKTTTPAQRIIQNPRGMHTISTGDPLESVSNAARFGTHTTGAPSSPVFPNSEHNLEATGVKAAAAAAVAQSSYQTILIAASHGNVAALQHLRALREMNGRTSTNALLAAIQQQPAALMPPNAIFGSAASVTPGSLAHHHQLPPTRSQSDVGYAEAVHSTAPSFNSPYVMPAALPPDHNLLSPFNAVGSDVLGGRGLVSKSSPGSNIQRLASQFSGGKQPSGSMTPERPAATLQQQPSVQQEWGGGAMGHRGEPQSAAALPAGLSAEDCFAIAQAFTEVSGANGNKEGQVHRQSDAVAAAKTAAAHMAMLQRHQQQLLQAETMRAHLQLQPPLPAAMTPSSQPLNITQTYPLLQLEHLLLQQHQYQEQQQQQQLHQQQLQGAAVVPAASPPKQPQQEGLLSGLTQEEMELIMARRARGDSGACSTPTTAGIAHQSPDDSHKATRISSAFQPYGNGNEPAATSPMPMAATSGPGAAVSCVQAAMPPSSVDAVIALGGRTPPGGPHHLQQPAATGPFGIAASAPLPNFFAHWAPGVAGVAAANPLAAAAEHPGSSAGGCNIPNLLAWVNGLNPTSESIGASHANVSGLCQPESATHNMGSNPPPAALPHDRSLPTTAEVFAALQVLKSSRGGAFPHPSSQSP